MLSSMRNAILAFPSLALMSSSVPPPIETTLPRYVKLATSSTLPELNVMGCVVLFSSLIIFVLSRLMISPVTAATSSNRLVFSCICWCECDSNARSSAKSRSSSCSCSVHWIPVRLPSVTRRITQSTTNRNRKGVRRQPCLPPVFTWNGSDSCPPWTTLHVAPWYVFFMMLTIFSGMP